MLKLYDFPRSSACYRVRIALHLKELAFEKVPVHLLKAEQHDTGYHSVNPQDLIPALDTGTEVFTQSLAIIEYIDERHPEPPFLPPSPEDRARVRAMAHAIALDIHPIQNLRVLNYLRQDLSQPEETVIAFARHWISLGLGAFQDLGARAPVKGRYSYGNKVTLADILLAPQLVNARRYGCDLAPLARLIEIEAALRELPAFTRDAPEG